MPAQDTGHMGNVDLLGFLVVTLNCNVTLVGKVWLIFTVLLRIGVLVLAGSPVYQDEQERFVCNTLQPGCTNVCYDLFSPVSLLRFWLVQSVSLLLPGAVFGVYVVHRGAQLAARGRPCHLGCPSVPDFSSGYLAQLLLRSLLEAAWAAVQYLLFGFWVPARFSCARPPCSGPVDCYVSRPTEKSIAALYAWAASALSLLLSVADLVCSVQRRTSQHPCSIPEDRGAAPRGDRAREGVAGTGMGGQVADCPSAKSGQEELPDGEESEALSSASDRVAGVHEGSTGGPPRDTALHPGDRGSTGAEHPSASRNPSQRASSVSAPHLRPKKSEWV